MDDEVLRRAEQRLAQAHTGARPAPGPDVEAALDRARGQLEALALTTAQLESALPDQVTDAIREGLRAEAAPMSRRVNESRGLMNQTLKRLERLEGDLAAERYARVDDLGLLVDLISASWRSADERLARIEQALQAGGEATVLHLDERRTSA
jgi:hypothetical protein